MPIIESLADLFRGGASFIAEQYIRGRSRASNLSQLLLRKFGSELNVSPATISQLEDRVRQAAIPALAVQNGRQVNKMLVPEWPGLQGGPTYIHTGLAKVSSMANTGEAIFTVHLPFSFSYQEILRLEDIRDRIINAIDTGDTDINDRYKADIDRIDQLIKYHQILGERETAEPELHGIYVG